MPSQIPVWLGRTGLTETPDSPKIVSDSTKTSIVRSYEGPYPQAVAGCPSIGDTFSDLPGTVEVVGFNLEKSSGGKGRLTITLETASQTTYEVEWVEIDKPLILNPRYWDGSTADVTPAGSKPLTALDKAMIEKWEAEENMLYKQNFLFKMAEDENCTAGTSTAVPKGTKASPASFVVNGQTFSSPVNIGGIDYDLYELSDNAQDYATKRLKGEESYRLYAPVVRQTSESIDPPTTNPCGIVETPPTDAHAPSGYVWQRSAQRLTRTGPHGKYHLQIEWQGAERIDTDIYGGSSGSTAENPDSLFGPINFAIQSS
jgi:hypothetical protein